ncbi:electron transporter SenC [Pseudomonas laurylsulfativorans]|uniref:Electron transporter SenC n=1 Tax=Pseudomonas laurylsulfativorans TaxID=1943631 RepID=A0A2S3VMJ5_9PSED|nr:SCO family protein [Pseudomonas laurylsulfativorans]POF41162.1 electron transporter SenC [Pseudomonas laurylsulfativorans]
MITSHWTPTIKFLRLLLLLTLGITGGSAAVAEDSGSSTPWGRDYFPNTELVNQDGQKMRFFDDMIKDKVVAINFIFTSCTDSCPLETARLLQVQKVLGDRVGKDVFLYSISIDPETDTPEVLKKYTEKFRIGPGWQFLTGNKDDITALRKSLGLFIDGIDNGRNKDHNLSLIIGNQSTGRWMKSSPMENPYILADRLSKTLQNWKDASTNDQDYASAPTLRPPSAGEQIYRTRCSSCHTLGDTQNAGIRSIGPDLIGVTRQRDPQWLKRWIKEPDQMLAEKDALAMQLYEQYNNIAMPNLRLGEIETSAVLTYLAEETERLQPEAPMAQDTHDGAHQHAGPKIQQQGG